MIAWISLFSVLISHSPALAARAGTVDKEGAELHQFPDKKSIVLIKLHKGTQLAASNSPTLGFHKVRLRSSLVGWVSAKSIVLQPMLSPTPEFMSDAPKALDAGPALSAPGRSQIPGTADFPASGNTYKSGDVPKTAEIPRTVEMPKPDVDPATGFPLNP